MGGCRFIEFGEAETAQKAFRKLSDEAMLWCGIDAYNGTISTTELVGEPVRIAEEWSERERDAAIELAERNGFGKKWESRAIDCGSTGDGMRMWAFYGWASC